ncbi:hypothetical protein [Aquimarina sp. 2201CG5-10]|uniref:hypothetical protein n=1 Tax=Aquimarina callyspongiae TaxID=3098150 RepID=UPI002AB34A8F|nr:hypothetical protein [Aquimarina sp. 2201CG5-10]MDY8137772.1 hypothetical protein [Aquimarina sp. 2201CG5-10]
MKRIYLLLTTLLTIVNLTSCTIKNEPSFTRENVKGEWLVQAVHMDKDFYRPNSIIMEFNGDTVYYKNIKNEELLGKNKLEFSIDSIGIDSMRLPINKFSVDKNKLQFIKSIAYRLRPRQPLDIKKTKSILSSGYWQNEKGAFRFYEKDQTFEFTPVNSDEYSTHCFELVTYKGHVFLLKKGNRLSCQRDFQFIEEIISVTSDEIETFGFVDGDFKKVKYKPTSKVPESRPMDFQLCNPYINKNYPRDRYYYQGTEYKGGLYHIRKIFNEKYDPPQDSKESGIYQVRFVVNCEGKAGMFEQQAFDYDYNLKEFSPKISNQIYEITKSLQDWNPGRNSKSNQVIDTYIYLSFRIKDGKIIRIYP